MVEGEEPAARAGDARGGEPEGGGGPASGATSGLGSGVSLRYEGRMQPQIFIAYASPQVAFARALKAALEARGVSAFMDEDVQVARWRPGLLGAQRAARVTVALVSREALASDHWEAEVGRAVDWARGSGHKILPCIIDSGAPPRAEWPSGLANWQSFPRGTWRAVTPDEVADHVRRALNESADLPAMEGTPTSVPEEPAPPEALAMVVIWLEANHPRPLHRKALLGAAGLTHDPGESWSRIVPLLHRRQLMRLIERAGEPDEVSPLLQAISHPGRPPLEDTVEEDLETRMEAARDLLDKDRVEEALSTYAAVESTARACLTSGDRLAWRRYLARARFGQAIAQNAAGRFDEARATVATVAGGDLDQPRLRLLARFLASCGEVEGATALAEAAGPDIVRDQLLALSRGELPEALADDADVKLHAAHLLLNSLRPGAAVHLALEALAYDNLTPYGRANLAQVLARGLYGHWLGMEDRVREPAVALRRLDELILGATGGDSWSTVREVRRWLDLEGDPPRPTKPETQPAWVDAFNALVDRGLPATELLTLAESHPHVGPLLVEAARDALRREDPRAAIDPARRAVAVLPGFGQRILLARCLYAADQVEEARAVVATFADDPRSEARTLCIQLALAEGGTAARDLAERWCREEPTDDRAWVWLIHVRMRLADVQGAKAAAREVQPGRRALPLFAWRALTAATLLPPVDRDAALKLARAIKAEWPEDPSAETLRVKLLLAAEGGRPPDPGDQVDWDLLVRAGAATPFTNQDMGPALGAASDWREMWAYRWSAGACVFETYAEETGVSPGLWARGFELRDVGVIPPLPPLTTLPPVWREGKLLVGRLAIEALAGLGLLEAFGAAVRELHLFADTLVQLMNGPTAFSVAAAEAEIKRTWELWAPLSDIPDVGASPGLDLLDEADVNPVRVWLGARGAGRRASGEAWAPRGGTVVLAGGFIVGLGRDLPAFIGELRRDHLPFAVESASLRHRHARENELRQRIEAARHANDIYRFLGALNAAGRLHEVPLPEGPNLPARPHGHLDTGEHRVFAAREHLRANADLILLSAEYAEMGIRTVGPPAVLNGRAWTPQTNLQDRYAGTEARWITLAHVVRDLGDLAHRRALARAGYVDALDGADLVHLHREYGTLRGPGAAPELHGLLRSAGPHVHPHHILLAFKVAMQVWPAAISQACLTDPPMEGAREFVAGALDALDTLDTEHHRRLRLVVTAIQGLVYESLKHIQAFAVPAEGDRVAISPDSRGGQKWQAVVDWAIQSPDRVDMLDLGVAAALRAQAARGEAFAGLVGAIYARLPARTGLEWTRQSVVLMALHEDTRWVLGHLGTDGATLSQTLTRARQTPTSQWLLYGLEVEIGPTLFPFELFVDAWGPQPAIDLARHFAPHDFRLAATLREWGVNPTLDTRRALDRAVWATPLRAVRKEPLLALGWSLWTEDEFAGPRGRKGLCELLGEPVIPDGDSQGGTRFDVATSGRFDGGAWADYSSREWIRQLARIPGGFVGAGAGWGGADLEDAELARYAAVLESIDDHDSGSVAAAVIRLAGAGGHRPERKVGDRVLFLPTLTGQLAAAALGGTGPLSVGGGDDTMNPPQQARERSFAECEGPMVRTCGTIVANVCGPLPIGLATWYAWRLFAWMCDQLHATPTPLDHARRLARAAPPPTPVGLVQGDIYSPERGGRVDWRELAVLTALRIILLQPPSDGEAPAAIDWRPVVPPLVRIASRLRSADEESTRHQDRPPVLGGPTLCASDLARQILLSADMGHLDDVTPGARLRWLTESLHDRRLDQGASELRALSDLTVLAFLARPSDAELELIVATALDPEFVVDTNVRRVLVVTAWRHAPSLAPRAEAACWASLASEGDSVVVGEWLRGHAEAETLPAGVAALRSALAARALDERPYLRQLSELLFVDREYVRVAARKVLTDLLTEPALAAADALGPLAGYVMGSERR